MAEIKALRAREILDSRGIPTVEVDVVLASGIVGRASIPSGASTGRQEAVELRDGGDRYQGKGVLKAIEWINTDIQQSLLNHDVRHQKGIDDILINLDGTPNKSRMGANALLGVSLAAARAAALAVHLPLHEYLCFGQKNITQLPVPLMNVMNGGAHANNNLDIQEFMIVPAGAPSFKEALRYGAEVFQALKALLKAQNFSTAVGDEGGFAPILASHEAAIHLILSAIEKAGFKPGQEISLAIDFASNEFYREGRYCLASENRSFTAPEWVEYLRGWLQQYPIISLEDAMAEDDWAGWKLLSDTLGKNVQLVGDDIFVTNDQLLMKGIKESIANAILIKPNQIGTLSETLKTIQLAKDHHYATVISHRSGETEDTFIADLAVAVQASQIKTGSLCRGERTAKYNQLLRIEEALGKTAEYWGLSAFTDQTKGK